MSLLNPQAVAATVAAGGSRSDDRVSWAGSAALASDPPWAITP